MLPARSAALLLFFAAQSFAQDPSASIRGRVLDSGGAPIPGARVALLGTPRSAYSNENGEFALSGLMPRTYLLRAQRLGYAPSAIDSVSLAAGQTIERNVTLQVLPLRLSEVVVSPGSYSLLDPRSSQQVLSREQLLSSPQLAEDLFRSLNRLPGLSGSEYNARLRIRNGGQDELLVLLDGLELVEPFHLKDLDAALSILDAEAIGNVELRTGGFGAQYGNRTTGVIDMTSATPDADRARNSFGLSFSNVRAKSEGRFSDGRGSWLASGRRGYLDVILKLIGEEDAPDPRYYDFFGKVERQLGDANQLSIHALVAGDALHYEEDNGSNFVTSHYDNQYFWTKLRSQLADRLTVTTLASFSRLTWTRDGRIVQLFRLTQNGPIDTVEKARIDDDRALDVFGAKQDWVWDASSRISVLGGTELRHASSRFEYHAVDRDWGFNQQGAHLVDTTLVAASLRPDGNQVSGYAALRARPWSRLTTETGIRADRHDWTGAAIVAPRASAAFDVSMRTTVRAGWGLYPQAHAIQDLSVVDGDTAFAPAERAEQRVLGVEHRLRAGWTLRAEAYDRIIRDPRARWINTDGDIEILPEVESDRLRVSPSSARVRGFEWLATYDRGGAVRASGSYVLSKGTQIQDGVETPRPFDERHAVALDLTTRSRRGWTWTTAFTMHSGWPFIPAKFVTDTIAPGPPPQVVVQRVPAAPLFVEHLPTYRRVDTRVSKTFDRGRHRIGAFIELFNLFGRENVAGHDYSAFLRQNGTLAVNRSDGLFLPRLPTLGVRWEF
jgi:hypothetical protein